MTGVTQLFSAYEATHVEAILSPISGLPAKHKFLPSIAEIREALEEAASYDRRIEDYQRRFGPDRMLPPPVAAERPTLDELRDKHGENWGLHPEKQERGFKPLSEDQLKSLGGLTEEQWNAIPDTKEEPHFQKAKIGG